MLWSRSPASCETPFFRKQNSVLVCPRPCILKSYTLNPKPQILNVSWSYWETIYNHETMLDLRRRRITSSITLTTKSHTTLIFFCKTRGYKTHDCNSYCNVAAVSSCDRVYESCKETVTLKAPIDIWAHFQGNTDDAFLHDLLARRNGVISITCHQLKKLLSYSQEQNSNLVYLVW
jgi:hypothetical protein